MNLRTFQINHQNHLEIGGVDVTVLAKTYQTPLYVMDEQAIRNQCRTFQKAFSHPKIQTEVIYASKAFLNIAMCELIKQEGLSLDVVSGGELYTALRAKFPTRKIYFHGNNKSIQELEFALENQVGTIIIDHEGEFKQLQKLKTKSQRVMLRINPGIEAHTHEYIRTTHHNSKFGVSIYDPKTLDLITQISKTKHLEFVGFHSHIGSQIFEEASLIDHAKAVLAFSKTVQEQLGICIPELNIGGGFGVYYTAEDQPIDLKQFLPQLLETLETYCQQIQVPYPKILIEPGRAIVAEAGITLYEIASIKETYGGKNYLFVDGSMADHMRTALYQAKYEAVVANKMHLENSKTMTVTGKACESGDILIKEIELPEAKPNDLLAVFSTGAYHYSMASNYNRLPKPAVVFVKDGKSKLVVKRETYADLVAHDLNLEV